MPQMRMTQIIKIIERGNCIQADDGSPIIEYIINTVKLPT
jgi:hypothetical protein